MQHPSVAEAAVIGKPEPMIGELVKAFVVLKTGNVADENLKLDIIAFARKRSGPAIALKKLNLLIVCQKLKAENIKTIIKSP